MIINTMLAISATILEIISFINFVLSIKYDCKGKSDAGTAHSTTGMVFFLMGSVCLFLFIIRYFSL